MYKIVIFFLIGIVLIPSVCQSGDFRAKKLTADIDRDGKAESVQWRKFATTDMGAYYQLQVIDHNGAVLWIGPRDTKGNNPFVFSSTHTGVSFPELLFDIDGDGYIDLLAPEPQSDVSPTYYRKLKWRGGTFEYVYSRPLMMIAPGSDKFVWGTGQHSYGTWVSKFKRVSERGLVEVDIIHIDQDGGWGSGSALLRFTPGGADVYRWIKPLPYIAGSKAPVTKKRIIGTVFGLDPYGDGFLSVRTKPNGKEIGRLYNRDRVEILGKSGKWYKIKEIRSGRVGWSHSNWIRID